VRRGGGEYAVSELAASRKGDNLGNNASGWQACLNELISATA
jgi:hypothetical protein